MLFNLAELVLATTAISSLLATTTAQRVCNNAAALCNRTYNSVVHLGAHDSPFVRNASNGFSPAGDQFFPSPTQLDAGVRLMSAQVHHSASDTGEAAWRLCHTACFLYDAGSLAGWLRTIKTWLDKHPNEVVTILLVNSDGANAATLGQQFNAANISHYGYVPPVRTRPMATWPTLNQLINTNKRLVTFIASLAPTTNTAAPYLLDEFTFIFENDYDNVNPQDFSCTANRPSQYNGKTQLALQSGRLPFMNHFLYEELGAGIEISSPEKAGSANAPSKKPGNLGDSANQCTKEYGKKPTYLFVDFFNLGPAIATVDRLNGVVGKTSGRTGPGASSKTSSDPVAAVPSEVTSAFNSMQTGMDEFISKAKTATGAMTGSTSTQQGSAVVTSPATLLGLLMPVAAGVLAL